MNEVNTKQLLHAHPKIFKQYKLSMSETAMCWLFECGDGWYDLIECLCQVIDNYMYNERSRAKYEKRKPCNYIEATQVKEKFGGLRFYMSHEPEEISGAVSMAERMSYLTCEYCGSTKDISQTKGYITTLCGKCMRKHYGFMYKLRSRVGRLFLPIRMWYWRLKWRKK